MEDSPKTSETDGTQEISPEKSPLKMEEIKSKDSKTEKYDSPILKKRSRKTFKIIESEKFNSFTFSELLEYTQKLSLNFKKREKKINKLKEKVKSLKSIISKLRKKSTSKDSNEKIAKAKNGSIQIKKREFSHGTIWIQKEPQNVVGVGHSSSIKEISENRNIPEEPLTIPTIKPEPQDDYEQLEIIQDIKTEPEEIFEFSDHLESIPEIKTEPQAEIINFLDNIPAEIIIVSTQKNKDMISYKGYNFRQEKVVVNKIYWSCKNKTYDCKSRLQTSKKINNNYVLIKEPTAHNHLPKVLKEESIHESEFSVSQFITDNFSMLENSGGAGEVCSEMTS